MQLGEREVQVIKHGHLMVGERQSKTQFSEAYLIHWKAVKKIRRGDPLILLWENDSPFLLDARQVCLYPHGREGIHGMCNKIRGSVSRTIRHPLIPGRSSLVLLDGLCPSGSCLLKSALAH